MHPEVIEEEHVDFVFSLIFLNNFAKAEHTDILQLAAINLLDAKYIYLLQ